MIANKTDIVKPHTTNLISETSGNFPVDHRQQYDDKQAYKSIVGKDYASDFLVGIGQTAFLAGCQVVTSQYLLSLGVIGLYPVMVSLVPVVGSGLVTLTNFSFDHSGERVRVGIEDKYKLPIQVLRTLTLSANAGKISFDLYQIDTLAKNSFDVIVQQEREYRDLPEPQNNNFFVAFLAILLVFFGAITLRKK
ncbi:hypothetical protein [Sphaerospermopsis sp. FACHB-1194]|uniref:hypothetical protein n=1 Tax=Sphaerospermopsis sp. FACHB-1194 TaxID=2692862 RepID=UPI001680078B|nr:hypothetical protein [Sphaerospermopsis sp. FACHB-1194]MBD2148447.1 hypothetical protein [Sphaerospermopsis sp. FACHB-1194]